MKKLLLIFCVFSSFKAFSALSPTMQSAAEIRRIFESNEVAEIFGGPDFIISIEKIEDGYLLKTEESQMLVKVVYEPSKKIGPQQFHLQFEEAKKIENNDNN